MNQEDHHLEQYSKIAKTEVCYSIINSRKNSNKKNNKLKLIQIKKLLKFDFESIDFESNPISKKDEVFNISRELHYISPLKQIISYKFAGCLGFLGDSIVKGSIGHNCVLFKKPIIQGSYYLQFRILDDRLDRPTILNFSSSIRIGICLPSDSGTIPLGGKDSIAYRTSTGDILHNCQIVEKVSNSQVNDIIGIQIYVPPPRKYRFSHKISKQSYLILSRNGIQQTKIQNLMSQSIYTIGFSLYNNATIEVRYRQEQQEYKPKQFEPYSNILLKPNYYPDLQIYN